MTDHPETPEQSPSSHSEQDARFLRGIGQWGGWTMNYTDPRIHAIERMESRGDVHVDRTNTGYIVVTLTAQSASWAPVLSAQSDIQQESERLMTQLEAIVNETPRIAYPALQAAVRDLDEAFNDLRREKAGPSDVMAAARHLLTVLYEAKLASKPAPGEEAS